MSKDFVSRLREAFDDATMAEVARRLNIPHATVRNYYRGRLPAPEVLMKIAKETNISLNWLLAGTGDRYSGQRPPMGLGKYIEERIGEIVDERLAKLGGNPLTESETAEFTEPFDVEASVLRLDDPQLVMAEWFRHEGREYPRDYGVVFFKGWETFSPQDKVAAVRDAKRVLERSL